ncbi:hypothetical protein MRB53_016021 [Persea americana]|uniref:Uncharacterized protein n=1 Tax=Persea americana TaxID=3435 RepID=A0ACC2M0Q9_PERAE|nr:hypothetical protein MRB53_016021 [Persea americana]
MVGTVAAVDVGSNGDSDWREALGIMSQTVGSVADMGHDEDGLVSRGPNKGTVVAVVGPGVVAGTLVVNHSVDVSNNAGALVYVMTNYEPVGKETIVHQIIHAERCKPFRMWGPSNDSLCGQGYIR